MAWFYNAVLFLFGAAMGSAANAIIDRLPRNESWFAGRSKCDKCGHVLNWIDLIPVFSFLWLRGKCRYCRFSIPFRNLWVEVVMGVTAILNFKFLIFNQLSIINYLIFCVTVIIAVMDWETKLVSEMLVIIWAVLIVTEKFSIFNFQFSINYFISQFSNNFWGLLVGVGLIGGIWAVSRGRAMGFGDVEIAAVMGWWLGWPKILVGLWAAFVSGAVVALWFVGMKKLKMKSTIAFGPFLVLGSWAASLWGDKIIRWLNF